MAPRLRLSVLTWMSDLTSCTPTSPDLSVNIHLIYKADAMGVNQSLYFYLHFKIFQKFINNSFGLYFASHFSFCSHI